jgi:hypothetical protein
MVVLVDLISPRANRLGARTRVFRRGTIRTYGGDATEDHSD